MFSGKDRKIGIEIKNKESRSDIQMFLILKKAKNSTSSQQDKSTVKIYAYHTYIEEIANKLNMSMEKCTYGKTNLREKKPMGKENSIGDGKQRNQYILHTHITITFTNKKTTTIPQSCG